MYVNLCIGRWQDKSVQLMLALPGALEIPKVLIRSRFSVHWGYAASQGKQLRLY